MDIISFLKVCIEFASEVILNWIFFMGKFLIIKIFLGYMAIQTLFLIEPLSVKCVFQGTYYN